MERTGSTPAVVADRERTMNAHDMIREVLKRHRSNPAVKKIVAEVIKHVTRGDWESSLPHPEQCEYIAPETLENLLKTRWTDSYSISDADMELFSELRDFVYGAISWMVFERNGPTLTWDKSANVDFHTKIIMYIYAADLFGYDVRHWPKPHEITIEEATRIQKAQEDFERRNRG